LKIKIKDLVVIRARGVPASLARSNHLSYTRISTLWKYTRNPYITQRELQ